MTHFMAIQAVLQLDGLEFKPRDFTVQEWRRLIERLAMRSISDVVRDVRNGRFWI